MALGSIGHVAGVFSELLHAKKPIVGWDGVDGIFVLGFPGATILQFPAVIVWRGGWGGRIISGGVLRTVEEEGSGTVNARGGQVSLGAVGGYPRGKGYEGVVGTWKVCLTSDIGKYILAGQIETGIGLVEIGNVEKTLDIGARADRVC